MTHVVLIGPYGSAGSSAAPILAENDDLRLTMVDRADPPGGLCINRGCMPSKELLSAAGEAFAARNDDRVDGNPSLHPGRAVESKEGHRESFAGHKVSSIRSLAEREGVELIEEETRFVGETELEVGGETLDPDYVLIATGSRPNVPDLPGIDEVDFYTSRDVLDATELPESGIVMGFGAIGLELAPYLVEAGVEVTAIEHDERPLDDACPEFGDAMLEIYRDVFGVVVLTEVREQRLESTGDGVRLHLGDGRELEADHFFLFTGRRPNLEPLDLENTALEPGPGWVEDTMRARDDHRIFVAGDATGEQMIGHVSKEEGRTAAENVLRTEQGRELRDCRPTDHRIVFSGLTLYPFARVGLTEGEADEKLEGESVVATREASSDGIFPVKGHSEGLAKLVVHPEDGGILGYQGLHLDSDVMAKTMQLAVDMELDVRELPDRAYHPTTPEILDGLIREASAKLDGRED